MLNALCPMPYALPNPQSAIHNNLYSTSKAWFLGPGERCMALPVKRFQVSVFRFQFFCFSFLTPDPPPAEHLKPWDRVLWVRILHSAYPTGIIKSGSWLVESPMALVICLLLNAPTIPALSPMASACRNMFCPTCPASMWV
jgi:hypothetical protein